MNYPYLIDSGDSYWIARDKGYCCGYLNKTCDLTDADWLREGWDHELNWEGEIDKAWREAHERLVSKLLLADKVVCDFIFLDN